MGDEECHNDTILGIVVQCVEQGVVQKKLIIY